jgi:hypothetical protein
VLSRDDPIQLDLHVFIGREEVKFCFNKKDYFGRPQLTEGTLAELVTLMDQGTERYGGTLLKSVFHSTVKLTMGYAVFREEVRRDSKVCCHLRLHIDEEDALLHPILWESLHDDEYVPSFIGIDRRMPISRVVPGKWRERANTDRLRVLVAIANPSDLGTTWADLKPLDPDAERKAVEDALADQRDKVDVQFTERASLTAIRERLGEAVRPFHVLHLVCHGGFDPKRGGVLLLEDDGPKRLAAPATEDDVAQLVSGPNELRLVVLAACESAARSEVDPLLGIAPKLVGRGVPAVVAMQGRVGMESARRFSRAFYVSLSGDHAGTGSGLVDVAVTQGREAILACSLDSPWEWAMPVLFMSQDGSGPIVAVAGNPDVRRGTGVTGDTGQELASRIPQARPPPRLSDLSARLHRLKEQEIDDIALDLVLDLGGARGFGAKLQALKRRAHEADRLADLDDAVRRLVLPEFGLDHGDALLEAAGLS